MSEVCHARTFRQIERGDRVMALKESDLSLNFPDAPDFISEPPKYTVTEMIALCEKMLPYWNAKRYAKPEVHVEVPAFVITDEPTKK